MSSNNEKDFSLDDSNKNNFFNRVLNYFSREEIIVRTLFIVGIFSILFGILGMYIRIKNSFIAPEVAIEDRASIIEGLNRIKDTDLDGLSDYDELNTYNTSPYLEDTDLDGVSDYDEMILGRDGECTGENCNTITAPKTESEFMTFLGNLDFQNIDFNTFKSSLIDAGYEKGSVDLITEEEFNQMKQMLSSDTQDTPVNTDASAGEELTSEEIQQIEQMRNLSVSEIRSLMIEGGATAEQLAGFSDEELKQIYLQTLDEISSSQ